MLTIKFTAVTEISKNLNTVKTVKFARQMINARDSRTVFGTHAI